MYPVCMYSVPKEVSGFSGQLGYVDTCPNEPQPGKAYCSLHCAVAEKKGSPTDLKGVRNSSCTAG